MAHTPATTIEAAAKPHQATGGTAGTALWIGGLVLILLALTVGKSIEDQLAATGMPDFSGGAVSPAQLAPLLFAFAFPLGLALCAAAAMRARRGHGLAAPLVLAVGAIAVAAPVLVPVLAGRELVSHHFGAGGVTITVAALASFWSLGRLRQGLPAPFVPALDLALLGLLCFAAAAWNLCGSAAMPSFLLMPERMAELETLPFAIGQMKAVLALLALGWVLVMAATGLAASRLKRLAQVG
jgi:hypothetical protein